MNVSEALDSLNAAPRFSNNDTSFETIIRNEQKSLTTWHFPLSVLLVNGIWNMKRVGIGSPLISPFNRPKILGHM